MIKDMCTVLRETNTPQIQRSLVSFKVDSDEVEGKCALGVLSCAVGKPEFTLSRYAPRPSWIDIVNQYVYNISMYSDLPLLDNDRFDFNLERSGLDLSDYIWMLNDGGFTFKQIADFLEATFISENE